MTPEDAAYFDRLLERRGSAVRLDPRAVSFRDGSPPQANKCHENADRWVRENPSCAAVRRWAIEAESGDHLLLVAHSVVQEGDGQLVDITLGQPHAFLRHEGELALFDRIRLNNAQRFWPPPPVQKCSGVIEESWEQSRQF